MDSTVPDVVVMLGNRTWTVHRPSRAHLVPACGTPLGHVVVVGPLSHLIARYGEHLLDACPTCWEFE